MTPESQPETATSGEAQFSEPKSSLVRRRSSRAQRRPRRIFLVMLLTLLATVTSAFAGSYLNRVALLVRGATVDTNYLRSHLHDRELAEVIRRVALARVAAAGGMEIPKEVQLAHPHALLVLEAHAQAAEAATQGDAQRFVTLAQRATDEERTLEAVLKQLGWTLPKL